MPRSPSSGRGFSRIDRIPPRTPDGPEQHRVGATGKFERGLGKCAAACVNRTTANERFGVGEVNIVLASNGIERPERDSHDLRTDAITWQDANFVSLLGHGHHLRVFVRATSPPASIISCMKGSKGRTFQLSPVVRSSMMPVPVSAKTASPSSMPSAAPGHSMMGSPTLMALR